MADLALTAAQVEPLFPTLAEIFDFIAAVAITKGQAVYQLTDGTVGLADANDAGKQQLRGIALKEVAAGQVVSVIKRGHLNGFTLTAQTWDDQLFLSDTVGLLADAAGTMTVPAGRVVSLPHSALTKVVYIEVAWATQWS